MFAEMKTAPSFYTCSLLGVPPSRGLVVYVRGSSDDDDDVDEGRLHRLPVRISCYVASSIM